MKHLAPPAAIAVLACALAHAQELPTTGFELKRQNTSRGAPEETTQTTLRLEKYDAEGAIALLRFDFPFPDARTDFAGSPLDPQPGDLKIRAGFRPLRSGDLAFPYFVEFTFPTANPKELGTGKYQASAGLRMLAPIEQEAVSRTLRFEGEVQHVSSYAGDPARKRVNYTKLEATLYGVWDRKYTLKAKLKPSFDWLQDGKSAAVAEVEGGFFFGQGWRTWLMVGRHLWGPSGIPSTYDTRAELGLARQF